MIGKINGRVTALVARYETHSLNMNSDQCTWAWSGLDDNTNGEPQGPSLSSTMLFLSNVSTNAVITLLSWGPYTGGLHCSRVDVEFKSAYMILHPFFGEYVEILEDDCFQDDLKLAWASSPLYVLLKFFEVLSWIELYYVVVSWR